MFQSKRQPQKIKTVKREIMRVLAIDSAMNGCSACICEISDVNEDARVLAQEKLKIKKGQAEEIVPMIERTIQNAQASYDELDLIGVTNGPGAFTGMRIAISTANAIALAVDKPVIGVSTISAVLESYLNELTPESLCYRHYAVVLETKRKDYYFQIFKKKVSAACVSTEDFTEISLAQVVSAAEITSIINEKDVLLIGDAINRLMSETAHTWPCHEISLPEGKVIAMLAARNYVENGTHDRCKPVYLREAEIGKAKTKPRAIKS